MTTIGITAIVDIVKTRYQCRFSMDLDGHIAIDIGDSFLVLSLSIIGDNLREYR